MRGPTPNGAIGEADPHECAALSTESHGQHLCNHKRAVLIVKVNVRIDNPSGQGALLFLPHARASSIPVHLVHTPAFSIFLSFREPIEF